MSRQEYQHLYYLKRKYPLLSMEELKSKSLELQIAKNQREIEKHNRWLLRYCRKHKGMIWLFFNDNPYWTSKRLEEKIFAPMRAKALKLLEIEGKQRGKRKF